MEVRLHCVVTGVVSLNDVLVLLLSVSAGLCVGATIVCFASFLLSEEETEKQKLLHRVERMLQ
jgi:hypothetical protein